jgi:hypothetical protein
MKYLIKCTLRARPVNLTHYFSGHIVSQFSNFKDRAWRFDDRQEAQRVIDNEELLFKQFAAIQIVEDAPSAQ